MGGKAEEKRNHGTFSSQVNAVRVAVRATFHAEMHAPGDASCARGCVDTVKDARPFIAIYPAGLIPLLPNFHLLFLRPFSGLTSPYLLSPTSGTTVQKAFVPLHFAPPPACLQALVASIPFQAATWTS